MVVEIVLYGFLAIVVAAALFALATRFLPAGEQIAPPLRDEPLWNLPVERSLHPEDVDSVRLPVALRGYRFAETDVLLDRLVHELRARDAEIARLRAPNGGSPSSPFSKAPADHDNAYARPTPAPASAEHPADGSADAGYAPSSFAPTPPRDEDVSRADVPRDDHSHDDDPHDVGPHDHPGPAAPPPYAGTTDPDERSDRPGA